MRFSLFSKTYKCNQSFSETVHPKLCTECWKLADDAQQKINLSSLIVQKPDSRRKVFAQKEKKIITWDLFAKFKRGSETCLFEVLMCNFVDKSQGS